MRVLSLTIITALLLWVSCVAHSLDVLSHAVLCLLACVVVVPSAALKAQFGDEVCVHAGCSCVDSGVLCMLGKWRGRFISDVFCVPPSLPPAVGLQLNILTFPCPQFFNQEPGDNDVCAQRPPRTPSLCTCAHTLTTHTHIPLGPRVRCPQEILNGLKYVRPGGGYVPQTTMFQIINVNGLVGAAHPCCAHSFGPTAHHPSPDLCALWSHLGSCASPLCLLCPTNRAASPLCTPG